MACRCSHLRLFPTRSLTLPLYCRLTWLFHQAVLAGCTYWPERWSRSQTSPTRASSALTGLEGSCDATLIYRLAVIALVTGRAAGDRTDARGAHLIVEVHIRAESVHLADHLKGHLQAAAVDTCVTAIARKVVVFYVVPSVFLRVFRVLLILKQGNIDERHFI